MKKLLAILLSVVLLLGVTGCSEHENPESQSAEGTGLQFTAGTYTAKADGRNAKIEVEVTFDDTSIQSVKILSHEETPGISDMPLERIPAQIVEKQSLAIDAVASATLTSNGILAAVEDCVKQAGGDVEALKAVKDEGEKEVKTVQQTAEVVIVGGGAAGMSAAISAAENGAKSIILLEKTATLGGNAAISGGFFDCTVQNGTREIEMTPQQLHEVERIAALESKNELMSQLLDTLNADLDAYKASGATYLFDSPEFAALQYYEESKFGANLELLYEMQVRALDVYKWFEGMGLDWSDLPNNMIGGMWRRFALVDNEIAGVGYFKLMEKVIKEKNYPVQYLMETAGKELMVKDGRVVGIKAVGVDGTQYELTAEKGVLLASGGFSANAEMREKYNNKWSYVGEKLLSTSKPSMQGDGINMALAVGADLVDMGNIQMLPIADPDDGTTITMLGNTTNLFFNKQGKRFVDETSNRDTITNAILEQDGSLMYILRSQDNALLDENGCFVMSGLHIDDLIANGDVITGDTIEELAEKLEIDPAVLKKTVEDYNAAVESGEDKEFGRIRFDANSAYLNGPFYACPRKPASHNTKGGVVVNIKTEVLNTEGEVIPGLYAAGEVTGGRYRSGMPEAFTTGYTFGRVINGVQ